MITRTVVFPMNPTENQKDSLLQTSNLYTQAYTFCLEVAWDMANLSAVKVHQETYKKLKRSLGLKSQYLCSARNRAVETVNAMRVLKKKGKKVSKPVTTRIPIRLDARTLSFDKERETVSIATQQGRIKIPILWHKQALRYKDWGCKAGEVGTDRKGRWVIRLIFEKSPEKHARTGNVVGIDRGIRHAVVSSDNRFLGDPRWKEQERKVLFHISRLQSKGTKSAKRTLKRVSGRLRRFKKDCDYVVAKGLISSFLPGDTIVLEKLTNIKQRCGQKRNARKKHRVKMGRWSFKRLENAIKNYAELGGIYIEYVEPHYTSQMCSKCGVILKSNRKSQSCYSCSCGLKLNADLNASRNISTKWRIANGNALGLSVNQPIVADYN